MPHGPEGQASILQLLSTGVHQILAAEERRESVKYGWAGEKPEFADSGHYPCMKAGSAQALHAFSDAINMQTKYASIAMMKAFDHHD